MKPTNIFSNRAKIVSRRWHLVLWIVTGLLIALPAWGQGTPPDYNDDGAIDFCDAAVFVSDFMSGNLRSDLNNDGDVNIMDVNEFLSVYCDGPDKTAVNGTATIGAYFDTAGLGNELVNVPANTLVEFYVVAHGVEDLDGIGGYTFRVTENSSAVIASDAPPAGFFDVGSGSAPIDDNTGMHCTLASDVTCLGPAGSIVLNTYSLLFLGVDTTIEVVGLNDCSAPSASPSYVSCGIDGVPCDWTYFTYGPTNGQAFVTSEPVGVETESWSAVKALYR